MVAKKGGNDRRMWMNEMFLFVWFLEREGLVVFRKGNDGKLFFYVVLPWYNAWFISTKSNHSSLLFSHNNTMLTHKLNFLQRKNGSNIAC
jgi:hypothetical protein